MDVYDACLLSTVNQAGFWDRWGNFYLAEYNPPTAWQSSPVGYWTRNRRSKNWNRSTITHLNRVGNKWRPVAPVENK